MLQLPIPPSLCDINSITYYLFLGYYTTAIRYNVTLGITGAEGAKRLLSYTGNQPSWRVCRYSCPDSVQTVASSRGLEYYCCTHARTGSTPESFWPPECDHSSTVSSCAVHVSVMRVTGIAEHRACVKCSDSVMQQDRTGMNE